MEQEIKLFVSGRPITKYLKRRGEWNDRAKISEGWREYVKVCVQNHMRMTGATQFSVPVIIGLKFCLEKGQVADGKNLYANVEDALVDSKIIVDDNHSRVKEGTFKFCDSTAGPGVEISIRPVST